MDKAILKKFASESRVLLMTSIENELKKYHVDEEFDVIESKDLIILKNDKKTLKPLTKEQFSKRNKLINRIHALAENGDFEQGKRQVIEESAYTWFNRIIIIRYMELKDIIPLTKDNKSLGIRVLSSKDNTPHPEILKLNNRTNIELDLNINEEEYTKLVNENEQFNYILKLLCDKLGNIIPPVFKGKTDYIDILLPDNLLSENGFVTKVIKEIPERNFKEGVEIIGWLYQYYNQSEKDRVIAAKKKYKKNEIPYATQLFTPDWVVRYMVENSLGRYWIEKNGESNISNEWKYFVKENLNFGSKSVKVKEINNKTVAELNKTKVNRLTPIEPKEITFLDPCCGSGHILVYAFEMLYKFYLKSGYSKNDIAELILKNNLYGLDIDYRAEQLANASVVIKAREYDEDIFNKEIIRNLNIMSIPETNNISESIIDFIIDEEGKENAKYLIDNFKNAKEIGSLLLLEDRDYTSLINEIEQYSTIYTIELEEELLPIIKVAKMLTSKYDIVTTNPPYIGSRNMSIELKKYVEKNYKNAKSDLFACFMIRDTLFGKEESYLGYMTPFVWMFISSFKKLRKEIINNLNITSLIQLEYSAFKEATVPICTFVLKNKNDKNNGIYFRLTDFTGGMDVQEEKFLEILDSKESIYYFNKSTQEFLKIPDTPIAYWISEDFIKCFNNKTLKDYGAACVGLQTSDNTRFLREWYEVNIDKIGFNIGDIEESVKSKKKWFPYNKGGGYRKWYGNTLQVVNWENNGAEIRGYNNYLNATRTSNIGIANTQYYFRESGTWGLVSSAKFSVRYSPKGAIFDTGGSSLFSTSNIKYLIGLLNTTLVQKIMTIQNPTLNFQPGNVAKIPVIIDKEDEITKLVEECINISQEEWDDFEISWDFKKHPLLKYKEIGEKNQLLSTIFEKWNQICKERFNKLKINEEKLNKMFIEIYGLQNELTEKIEDRDITIRKADKEREIKSLISYAVGCMFGRYSLDKEGLVFANEKFDKSEYKTFEADIDNIIPITDKPYFKNDIVENFKKFIEVAFGEETLKENLEYIANCLGRKNNEGREDTIRRYFINNFFKDHIQIYQNKPIYWLFDSGKKNGFKCLIYMHRYDEDTVAKIRLNYLNNVQRIYENRLNEINIELNDTEDLTTYDVKKLEKEQNDIQTRFNEIKTYNDKLTTIGNQKIKINLDDGVVKNYKKFKYTDPITGKQTNILGEEKLIISKKANKE